MNSSGEYRDANSKIARYQPLRSAVMLIRIITPCLSIKWDEDLQEVSVERDKREWCF